MPMELANILGESRMDFIRGEFRKILEWADRNKLHSDYPGSFDETTKALLFAQAAELEPGSRWLDVCHAHLHDNLDIMFKNPVSPGLYNNAGSLLIADMLDPEVWEDYRDPVVPMMADALMAMPHPLDIDLIKGFTGSMRFFLETADLPVSAAALRHCFEAMLQDRLEDGDGWFWLMYPQHYRNDRPDINLSTSHGTLGWLGTLADYDAFLGGKDEGVREALEKTYRWFIANIEDRSLPSTMDFENGHKTITNPEYHRLSLDRVAWCYGMLGGAFPIHAAERALGVTEGKARMFWERLAEVPVLRSGSKVDNVICHGSIGNVHLFAQALRLHPGSEPIQKALLVWMDDLIEVVGDTSRTDWFRNYVSNSLELKEKIPVHPHGFLTGYVGAGLVYGSLLGATIPWDRLLQTSFRWVH